MFICLAWEMIPFLKFQLKSSSKAHHMNAFIDLFAKIEGEKHLFGFF